MHRLVIGLGQVKADGLSLALWAAQEPPCHDLLYAGCAASDGA